ncbi:exopolyphosphatase [Paraglaciecola hydrolytica]|uniref:Exopolyphosphatase n=1 Tax=Paraglaciecola hydrolytica TaxID=1799789 RepID=A0A148KL07_9ALTE|nr:exopolyphosphatase [Paraglaciecola hydrolytica]KXI26986.1 exopolyphosphatase [Paraglaciecola hydrolytica]
MLNLNNAFEAVEVRESLKVAALDIGSNSFHLVVARIVAGSVQILHRVKQKVRLADGLSADGELSAEAQQRGLDTLANIAESLQDFAPESVRVVATHTLRKANNAKTFLQEAKKIFPFPIEVISGAEEARLIYQGVAHTNHQLGQRLVIDIGGGSTEFIIGEGFDTKILRSLQMGCVSYTNTFFKNGELKAKAFAKAITAAQQELEMIDRKFNQIGWQSCIGTSGTIKSIIELASQLDSTNRDNCVSLSDLNTLMNLCCAAGNSKDLKLQDLNDDRRPVFAAGLAILIGIFKSLNINEMEYSAAALREGVLYEMGDQLAQSDIRQRSADSLATRYDVDIEQAKRVLATTMALYQAVRKSWDINHPELKSLLGWAALLHEVGLQINTRGVQRHSGYILQNIELPGFGQEQQNLLATLVRFHRKKIRTGDIPEFTLLQQNQVYKLLALLRLGVLLNIKRQDDILPEINVKVDDKFLTLGLPSDWLSQKPVFSADLEREQDYLKEIGIKLLY